MTDTMVERLSKMLQLSRLDMVVVLGGTNDIGMLRAAKSVTEALAQMYALIGETHKAQCIAVTIPPIRNRGQQFS